MFVRNIALNIESMYFARKTAKTNNIVSGFSEELIMKTDFRCSFKK